MIVEVAMWCDLSISLDRSAKREAEAAPLSAEWMPALEAGIRKFRPEL